jgi:hypothetical protein
MTIENAKPLNSEMSDLFCQSQESLNRFDAQTLNVFEPQGALWAMALPNTRMRKMAMAIACCRTKSYRADCTS